MADGKTTKMDERKKKDKNRTGVTSEGNVGTGGNMNSTKKHKTR